MAHQAGPAEPFAPNMLQVKSITVSGGSLFNYMDTRKEILHRAQSVIEGIQKGWLKLRIEHVYSLEQAATAQRMLESRQTMGKVILKMGE